MFIKIHAKHGWVLKEAKQIQYSAFPFAASSNSKDSMYRSLDGSFPSEIRNVFDEENIEDIDIYDAYDIAISDNATESSREKTFYYAILDETKGVVFCMGAYIINDAGKTIAKI